MKYFFLIALMGLGTSLAQAADTNTNSTLTAPAPVLERDVRFNCSFHSHNKKGAWCTARGEVCVRVEADGTTITQACDHDRDDNRLRIECSNGFRDEDRATATLRAERDRDFDLVIRSVGRDEDRIVIEEVGRFERDRKAGFPATLNFDRKERPSTDLAEWEEGREPRGRLFGRCELRLERDLSTDVLE
ncbi:MAG: hypothetical protein HY075_06535 [Deltaproteobacteria bacterium]|nr:hypothetical protein [Deltaproteobacteria bacterium]